MVSLKEFVESALKSGLSHNEIGDALVKKGYSIKDINSAFNSVALNQNTNMGFIQRIKILFISPKFLFDNIREDQIGKVLMLYLFVSAITMIIRYGLDLLIRWILPSAFIYTGGIMTLFGFYGGLYEIFFQLILLILGFVFIFFYAGIAHTLVSVADGDGNFVDTFNVVAYAMIPFCIISIIPIVGYLGFIYSIIVMTQGFSVYHRISKGKAAATAIVPLILLSILFLLLFAYLFISSYSVF